MDKTIATLGSGLSTIGELVEYPEHLEGGRNLILNKDYTNSNQYQAVSKTGDFFLEQPVFKGVKIEASRPQMNLIQIAVQPKETYVFTLFAKEHSANKGSRSYVIFFDVDTSTRMERANLGLSGVWERLEIKFSNESLKTKNLAVYFYLASAVGDITYFAAPKLEAGEQSTAWTPAPEDEGLFYPEWVKSFRPSFSEKGVMAQEFIEGEATSLSSKLRAESLKEGGV